MPTTALPDWLKATWMRSYIKRGPPGGPLGDADATVAVRYIQTLCGGASFDLRIAETFSLPAEITCAAELSLEQIQALASGAIEGFVGVTRSETAGDNSWVVRWHAAWLYPPQLGNSDEPQAVLAAIAANEHETGDVGRAVPTMPTARSRPVVHWLEFAPDGSYEEEWKMLDDYFKQGAHLAAVRPARSGEGACCLAILGSTFGFVRDIDRAALPAAALDRSLADVLADDDIALEVKQRLVDCDFSFGYFGQGGGVGGVVERSSLPWRKGFALATLIGEQSDWQPVQPSDEPMLRKALDAITADHAKACQALREAEESGQGGVAEGLRARGASL